MKAKYLTLLLILMNTLVAYSQSDSCKYSVSGKVLDVESKKPIPYANIKVKGVNKFTASDINGKFQLDNLCSEEVELIISCIGYSDSVCTHHHEHGDAPHFYLTQKAKNLDEVLVEAEKSKEEGTQSVAQQSIQAADLVPMPAQTLATSIASIEGVSFTSMGSNVQLPIIHGLYGNRILVVNNGFKHGFQNWSRDHAPEIDVASANSITILKGAAGVQFGPEALGGAIIIESNPLYLNNPMQVDVGGSYQTNGRGYSANASVSEGFKKWSYFINANQTQLGDREAPDYLLTNTGREEQSFAAGTRFHHKNFDLKLIYTYVDQNLALLRSSIAESGNSFIRAINSEAPTYIRPFSYDINEPNQLTEHHLGKAELSWWYSEKGKLTLRAGRQMNFRQEFDVRRNEEKPIIDLDLNTNDYQLEWKHPEWLGFDGLIGVQYFNQENRNNPGTGTTAFIPNYDTERWSAFIIQSKKVKGSTLEFGLRLDHEDDFIAGRETSQALFRDEFNFTNVTTSIGLVSNLTQNISFRTNLGTAWRAPNMAELYSFGQHGFKTSFGLLRYYYNDAGALRTNRVIEFNDGNVKAENGFKFINELEINQNKNRHLFTAYSHYIQNFIFDRPYAVIGTVRGPMPVFIFDQADAFFAGLDYSWKKTWSEKLSGRFGISYLYSRNIEDNEALINQTPIQTQYELKYTAKDFWKFETSTFSLRPSYTFQQFQAPQTISPQELIEGTVQISAETEIFDFADAPEGYFLLDFSWQFSWKYINGGVTVQNIFNQAYRDYLNEMRYFADEPGRNIVFNLNFQFQAKNQ